MLIPLTSVDVLFVFFAGSSCLSFELCLSLKGRWRDTLRETCPWRVLGEPSRSFRSVVQNNTYHCNIFAIQRARNLHVETEPPRPRSTCRPAVKASRGGAQSHTPVEALARPEYSSRLKSPRAPGVARHVRTAIPPFGAPNAGGFGVFWVREGHQGGTDSLNHTFRGGTYKRWQEAAKSSAWLNKK